MNTACYVRISKEQGADPTSIRNQIRNCRRQALEQFQASIPDEYIFEEPGKTGASLDRPELQRLFSLIEAGLINRLFVNTMDRLSRDMTDLLIARRQLVEADVYTYAVKDDVEITSDDDFIQFRVALGGWQGQMERRKITQNLQDGRMEKIRRGEWGCGGAAPFGYQIIRHDHPDGSRQVFLEVNPEEAAIVRRIFDMYLLERLPVTEICYQLNLERIASPYQRRRNRSSRGWYDATIATILKNATYTGKHEYRMKIGQTLIVQVPSIISEEDHRAVLKRFAEHHRIRKRKYDYLLQAKIWCGYCGRRYLCATGRNWRGYKCSARAQWKLYQLPEPCDNKIYRYDDLEQQVWADLVEVVNSGILAQAIRNLQETDVASQQAHLVVLQSALEAKDEAEARLLLDWAEQRTSQRAVDLALNRLAHERDELRRQVGELERAQGYVEQLEHLLARLDELKQRVTSERPAFAERRDIVEALIHRVTITGEDIAMDYAGLGINAIHSQPTIQRAIAQDTR